MFEVIALIFATRHIGRLAQQKGLKPLHWKLFVILSWLTFEFWGVMLGLMIFDRSNYVSILLIGLTAAFTGYVLVRKRLEKFPDKDREDTGLQH